MADNNKLAFLKCFNMFAQCHNICLLVVIVNKTFLPPFFFFYHVLFVSFQLGVLAKHLF
jgi:hypothetical protein